MRIRGARRGMGPSTYARIAEITSGRAIAQQGLATTCKDPARKARAEARGGAADKAATQLVRVQPRQLSMSNVKRSHIPVWVTGRAMRGVKGLAARRASAAVGAVWRPSECRSPKVIE